MNSETEVVIVVGVELHRRGTETINSVYYELIVICVIKSKKETNQNI